MIPYEDINIGDVFNNPSFRGYGKYSGLDYYVIDKGESQIVVESRNAATGEVRKTMNLVYPHRIFREDWRVINAKEISENKG